MTTFHRSAADGTPLAEAARASNLAWLDDLSRPAFPRGAGVPDPAHPALWAAYVCVGNDGGEFPRSDSIDVPVNR